MADGLHYEDMITAFTQDYLSKLYYFCLKKTGSVTEAEDLCSDISINILSELKKGTIPRQFSPWVWTIAKNRYSLWADRKNKQHTRFSGNVLENEIPADDTNIEAELIRGEELALLRRELSFISKDYREIVVAYYIDDLKVQTIAQKLHIPQGTIMSKLFRARKTLKEGMKMAREFGTRSYKPEDFSFSFTGFTPNNLICDALKRQLQKNILLEAHNNPSTIEELAMEIGVAMPYMEEEVKILLDAELLAEEKGKYVTSFLIASKELQLELYNTMRKNSKQRSEIINEIVTNCLPEIRNLEIVQEHYCNKDFKWLIVTLFTDFLLYATHNNAILGTYKRKDGGNWGITGYEYHNLIAENTVICHNGAGFHEIMFWVYSYYAHNINAESKLPKDQLCVSFLTDVIKNKRNINSFSLPEKEMWETLRGGFARENKKGEIIVDSAIFSYNKMTQMNEILIRDTKYEHLQNLYHELFSEVKTIMTKHSNPAIHNQLGYYTATFMLGTRGMTINDLTQAGNLILPHDTDNCIIGLYAEM